MNPPPGSTADHLNRGAVLLRAGQFRKALKEYDSVLHAEPENAEAHLGVARSNYRFVVSVNEKLNEYKFVEITGRPQYPVIDIDGDMNDAPPGTLVSISPGDMQRLHQAMRNATEAYEKVLRINPHHADALAELGDIMVSTNPEKGFALLNQALQADPDNALANWITGEDHLNKGRPAEAFRQLARAVRTEPDNHKYWFSLARFFAKTGMNDQAIDGYFHVIALRPGHRDALFNLGTEFFEKKDPDMARKFWGQFLETEPGSADAMYIHRIFPDLKK
jgi:cytochrome c-type biogenesis protein CcmH/NrfG